MKKMLSGITMDFFKGKKQRVCEEKFYAEVRRNLPEDLRMMLSNFDMKVCMGNLHLVRKINIHINARDTTFASKECDGSMKFRSGFSEDPSYRQYIRKFQVVLPIKEKPCVWLSLEEANWLSCCTEYSFPCKERLTLDTARQMASVIAAC